MDVIEKIETLRKERNWTKYRLAEETALSYSTLASMYARKTPPKLDLLEIICSAFGITLAQFFSDGEREEVGKDEMRLLQYYRRLPQEKKQAVLLLLED